MAESKTYPAADAPSSVSALGLRWAALRGMLGSPLIEAEEQRSLRDELVRELQTIEREFAGLPSRNMTEASAKLDVVKTFLRQNGFDDQNWIVGLLESVQSDVRSFAQPASTGRSERPPVNFTRSFPARVETGSAPAIDDAEPPAVA